MEIKEIKFEDDEYPKALYEIDNPPKVLYCIGNVSLLNSTSISIVGTRKCTGYGRWAALELSRKIASMGVTIVSGLAEGVDAAAHSGALNAGGNTIAVLGTAIDKIYPKCNKVLYERICSKGLVISEYAPGEETHRWCFPQRNRIISGLSKAVIVTEGTVKSGSMITANYALLQGKEVYGVPGNIDEPNAYGVNLLIREGATPIIGFDDLEYILGLESEAFGSRLHNL